ncbi:hypothetical protein CERSUDRAFT_112026 [Gelatoporia subvermispora B]|uniref:Epoxide hydrolase N-terminal domain-containing protein n=1 Tax=Ceriporiopsis subvermispora (strain B) TaxID=914234 RepID=M2R564_CERS8|nr:hypothetical protein CERSUDRAFT_112026 [Gelatoporia subvermispora B]
MTEPSDFTRHPIMANGYEQPFSITVPPEDLELLRKKLEVVTFPDEIEHADWDYGVPLAHMKRLVAHWKDGFDWRKAEGKINAFPQFTRDIDVDGFGTLNIHYVHQRSAVENAIPLLFIHGWPGHFMEARKIIPLLTASSPDQPSFHVIAPSLPGFGFSEAPKQKGFALTQYAEVAHKLMLALGYPEYVVQGGDWGYTISRKLTFMYGGKSVKAWHSNFAPVLFPSFWSNPFLFLAALVTPWTPAERAGLEHTKLFGENEMGYIKLQSTRPQTLGYALADSPVALLAWIYEKLMRWTDEYPWEDDEVLTWVSLYWFSRAGPAASVRIYCETMRAGELKSLTANRSSVPLGFSFFPKENFVVPKLWTRALGNVIYESEHERGGHFAAHERPEDLVSDVRQMFAKDGPAHGIVPGKSGYA